MTRPSGVTCDPYFDRFATVSETWTLTAVNASSWTVVGSVSGAKPNAATGSSYNNGIISFTIGGTVSGGQVISVPVTQDYVGGCFGHSRKVDLHPYYTPVLVYFNNTGFSCGGSGAMTDFFIYNERGDVESAKPNAQTDARPGPDYGSPRQIFHTFDRFVLWMNQGGAYRNRIAKPQYIRWVVADNVGTDLSGATDDGVFERGLFVAISLNIEPALLTDDRHAFATYHHSIAFKDLSFFNFPVGRKGPTAGYGLLNMPGPSESWDYYTSAVEMGSRRNSNWKKYNVSMFERTPPANIEEAYDGDAGGPDAVTPGVPQKRYWTLAGALYDNEGLFAGRHGDYLIFDHPFLDYELSNRRPVVAGSKTIATSDRFMGCYVWQTDFSSNRYGFSEAITFVRLDTNFNDYATWQIKDGTQSSFFSNMRHAAFHSGGRFKIYNQDRPAPNSQRYSLVLGNGNANNDTAIFGIPWSGSVTPEVHVGSALYNGRGDDPFYVSTNRSVIFPRSNTRNDLVANPRTFWHDTGASVLWMHHKGGFTKHSAEFQEDNEVSFNIIPLI